jgi:hypothetical protein
MPTTDHEFESRARQQATRGRKELIPIEPWKVFGLPEAPGESPKNHARRLTKRLRLQAMQAVAPLIAMGYNERKVAKILGLTMESVKTMVNAPDFGPIADDFREKMLARTGEALAATQIYAIQTLMDLLSAGSEYVREKAANDLLAHGESLRKLAPSRTGEEQQQALIEAAKSASGVRVTIEVRSEGGKFRLVEVKRPRELIEGVSRPVEGPAEAVEAPDEEVDTPGG